MEWFIGNVKIKNQICLAPMAGVTNPTYINICEKMGLGYAVTELISAEAIVRNNKKTLDMLKGIDKINIPMAVQIFGSNPEVMASAAKILVDTYHIKIIDINMGCPVPKVAIKSKAGSSLLKDPELVREIVSKVVNAVSVPVTVKIRSGWDEKSINAPLIAKICESSGAKAIFVHARTRSQGYSGKANLQIIKEVVDAVNIPVIGNGDIKTCYDAKYMLDECHCKAVMIGRGALGNPWLIKECLEYIDQGIIPKEVTLEEKIKMMKYYTEKLVQDKNEYIGVLEMRTNLMYFLKGMNNTKNFKLAINKATTKDELINIIDNYQELMEL